MPDMTMKRMIMLTHNGKNKRSIRIWGSILNLKPKIKNKNLKI